MKRSLTICLVVMTALAFSGCMVPKDSYTEAVQEADAARVELDRVHAQKAATEQQVKTLKELNAKLSQEAQLVKDELQRIEHGRDTERVTLEQRNKQLETQLRTLAAQHRQVRKQYQDIKRQNRALNLRVSRYQKELKDRGPTDTAVGQPGRPKPLALTPKSAALPKPPAPPALANAPTPPPAPNGQAGQLGATLVNLNTASESDMIRLLSLSKDDATRVASNRPYRIKGELVAKNVIPRATFDRIKGRITVGR